MFKECCHAINHNCDIWIDYQIALQSLEEAEELSHQNWIEIQHLHERVSQLETFIYEQGLQVPEELT